MSLVNDVLRQLDRPVNQPEHGLPLQAILVNENDRKDQFLQKALLAFILLLSLILIVQLVYNKPLFDIFSSNKAFSTGQEDSLKVLELADVEIPVIDEFEVERQVIASAVMPSMNVAVEFTQPLELTPTPLEVISTDSKGINLDVVEVPSENTQARIRVVEIPGLKQYQLALKAYKKKQNLIAMNWIDSALIAQADEKYSILKARIYIQRNDGKGLHQFVLNQEGNNSLPWFQLVAPGLQIYGYHQLSNQFYEQLIKHQPKETKWQLAMALNYSKLGLDNKTSDIYQSLLKSSYLTKNQKRWIIAQLNKMENSKSNAQLENSNVNSSKTNLSKVAKHGS